MDSSPPLPNVEQPPVVVHLFAAARLEVGNGEPHALDRKTAAMLALAHFEPGISRATAARWLWPDSETSVARTNLRVLLFRLARVAGAPLARPGNFLHLADHVAVVDDVAQLRSIAASNGARRPLPMLLEGVEADDLPSLRSWLERTRARIAARIQNALRERALMLEDAGRIDAAVALAEWLVDIDPGEEAGYRELMRLQLARGERTAALAAYERCRRWMNERLGIDPSAATEALHMQALEPTRAAAPADGKHRVDVDHADLSVVDLCRRLERLMGEGGERHLLERLARAALLRLPDPDLDDDASSYCSGIVARYHFRAGHAADAAAWSDQALATARRVPGNDRLGWVIGQRVNIALESLDLGLACELLAEGERIAHGQPDKLSRVWHQIGAVLLAAGRLDAAETAMRRSISMLEAYAGPKDKDTIARLPAMRINLALCLIDEGRLGLAEEVLGASLADLDRQPGFRASELRVPALLNLACVYRLDGRIGQARTALALARTAMSAVTMARYRTFADFFDRLVVPADIGAASAGAALEWAGVVDYGDASRLPMLRTLIAICVREGWRELATQALEEETRLRLRGCKAMLRGQERRWLRAFGRDAEPASARMAGHAELEVFERMCAVAELREGRDGGHGARVGRLASQLARYIGAPSSLVDHIEAAARLHDVGKAALSDQVLRAGRDGAAADDDAQRLLAQHTSLGAAMLAGQTSPAARLAELIALQHHERWDGRGLPFGLAGPAIGLAARLVAIADAGTLADGGNDGRLAALARIDAGRGSEFDPQLARAFILMLRSQGDAAAPAGDGRDLLEALPTPD